MEYNLPTHQMVIQFLQRKDAKKFIKEYKTLIKQNIARNDKIRKNYSPKFDDEWNLFDMWNQKIINEYDEITYIWSNFECPSHAIDILEEQLKQSPYITLFGHIGETLGDIKLVKYGPNDDCFSQPIFIEDPKINVTGLADTGQMWEWNR